MDHGQTKNGSARARAQNFVALRTFWRKPSELHQVWDSLQGRVDLDLPLGPDSLAFLGRIDIDDEALRAANVAAAAALDELRDDDQVLEWGSPGYPALLKVLIDAPRFLFVRTFDAILDEPAIAIVGTRNPSDEGLRRSRKLAHLLARNGITVVSGLARGIDTAAHKGALETGGRTIAVIGTPLTRYYPKENARLQDHIGHAGAVVSQFSPADSTTPLSFPLRNATMSGLSLGTVIIEAGETSGALVQARHCLAQGRKLFIPRSAVENPQLKWPKVQVELGAHVFSTIDDLLETLNHEGLLRPAPDGPTPPATALPLHVARG